jgi:hypothetical protein
MLTQDKQTGRIGNFMCDVHNEESITTICCVILTRLGPEATHQDLLDYCEPLYAVYPDDGSSDPMWYALYNLLGAVYKPL